MPSAAMATSSKVAADNPEPAQQRHEEHQYLDLVREILETGEHRPDRQVLPGAPFAPAQDAPHQTTSA